MAIDQGIANVSKDETIMDNSILNDTKVGAHKTEKLKTQNSFAIKEYDRVYNRLRQRRRGTISDAQWNALVGRAQDLKDKLLRGEVPDAELVSEYQKM